MTGGGALPFPASQNRQVRRFLVANIPFAEAGSAVCWLTYFMSNRDPALAALATLVMLDGLVGYWCLRQARWGHTSRAVVVKTASMWAVCLAGILVVPSILPAFVGVFLLGAILMVPYVSAPQLRVLLWLFCAEMAAVGALGKLQDLIGIDRRVPSWIITSATVAFLPVIAGFASLMLWHYRTNLFEALGEALASNAALRRSQQVVEAQAAELASSRRRLVEVADRERRAIERDLHDGAQQRILALLMGLRSAAQLLPPGAGAARERLDRLEKEVHAVLDEIRELAHGIYPPALRARGLPEALRDLAERAPVPVEVRSELDRRPPEPIEVAVYFACAEAVSNAAKHAGADVVVVISLSMEGANLNFSVVDDGLGAPGVHSDHGGLANIKDRIEALGGTVGIRTDAGAGFGLYGAVPVQ
jgi:signal transduction histidine kinase